MVRRPFRKDWHREFGYILGLGVSSFGCGILTIRFCTNVKLLSANMWGLTSLRAYPLLTNSERKEDTQSPTYISKHPIMVQQSVLKSKEIESCQMQLASSKRRKYLLKKSSMLYHVMNIISLYLSYLYGIISPLHLCSYAKHLTALCSSSFTTFKSLVESEGISLGSITLCKAS